MGIHQFPSIAHSGAFPSVSLLEPMVRFTVSECSWPSCAAQKADDFHRCSPGHKIINTTSVRSSTRHFRDIKITYFHHRITIECHLWDELWRPGRIDGTFLRWQGEIHGKSIAIAMGFIICKWMVFHGYITRGYMADGHSVRLLYHMIYNLVV